MVTWNADTKQAKADPGKGAKAPLLGPKNVARLTAAWVAYWTAGETSILSTHAINMCDLGILML